MELEEENIYEHLGPDVKFRRDGKARIPFWKKRLQAFCSAGFPLQTVSTKRNDFMPQAFIRTLVTGGHVLEHVTD
jgi:hypothetical protein